MAKRRANNEGTITKRKDGRWEAKIIICYDPVTGKPKRKSFYGKRQKEVEAKITEFKQSLRTGHYVEPSEQLFGDWIITWLEVYVEGTVRARTYADYHNTVKKHIVADLGHIPLKSLDTSTIQRFYNQKRKNGRLDGKGGLSPRYIHAMHQLIKGSLDQAVLEKKIPFNPSLACKLPPLKYEERHPYSKKELARYLNAAKSERLFAAFLLEATTGMRRGELLALEEKSFDPVKGTIRITQTLQRVKLVGEEKSKLIFSEPKTPAAKREIKLIPAVITELNKHIKRIKEEKLFMGPAYKDHGLLFPTSLGTPIDPRKFYEKHKMIIKRAGLRHISVHDLRHTFATILKDEGVDAETLRKILGHTKASTTMNIYWHSTSEGEEKALPIIENVIAENVIVKK